MSFRQRALTQASPYLCQHCHGLDNGTLRCKMLPAATIESRKVAPNACLHENLITVSETWMPEHGIHIQPSHFWLRREPELLLIRRAVQEAVVDLSKPHKHS